MFVSCKWIWDFAGISRLSPTQSRARDDSKRQDSEPLARRQKKLLVQLSMPQIVLATLALTTYHVQIITRLSSGYMVWYWWVASLLVEQGGTTSRQGKFSVMGLIVFWMVSYALIQASLFASFLPPA